MEHVESYHEMDLFIDILADMICQYLQTEEAAHGRVLQMVNPSPEAA